MRKSPSLLSQLTILIQLPIKDSELCTGCQNDINNAKSLSSKDNLLFRGPFLLEQKADYSVMSLPYYNLLRFTVEYLRDTRSVHKLLYAYTPLADVYMMPLRISK